MSLTTFPELTEELNFRRGRRPIDDCVIVGTANNKYAQLKGPYDFEELRAIADFLEEVKER